MGEVVNLVFPSCFFTERLATQLKKKSFKLGSCSGFHNQSISHCPWRKHWSGGFIRATQDGGALKSDEESERKGNNSKRRKRAFFLDVNPLCYKGSEPSPSSFAQWMHLFFSDVSHQDPVIAVLDGENGNDYRRQILPSYKAHRRKFSGLSSIYQRSGRATDSDSHYVAACIMNLLQMCNVPVIKINGSEADDVVATLVDQALRRGLRVVVASPDKDFKQLISEDVQIVIPMPEFGRWSFYALKHYLAQYNCDPSVDLSLRCILGDEVDGVPGLQHVAPGFGRKTALKLLKKHGSLENLLNAASIRTVGKPYAQEALTKHADYLRRNFQVLSLRRDIDVHLEDEWLSGRDDRNDSLAISRFMENLRENQKLQLH
ncbi:uncharacterized protein LOC18449113 [Amborella trichopoda]|uniref:uncharacterized protein LOC18449113 n=1 Tax=Amborella trichopoda TaxID=13333 RepID=UPI0005D33BBA|nr:uncharacterized protein LOC18449113 [Amborella trichopoda]XP_011628879.1 uncharacterized protein LOC18449113 [Amborella trichopoda]|eukprot:XP_011628878.1 uncharacterized protein LOC18449113 [Amborella trichopoda]